jgi:hypothetical protein
VKNYLAPPKSTDSEELSDHKNPQTSTFSEELSATTKIRRIRISRYFLHSAETKTLILYFVSLFFDTLLFADAIMVPFFYSSFSTPFLWCYEVS